MARSSSSSVLTGRRGDALLEGLAFEQFHRDEGLAFGLVDIVDGADVRMIERGSRLRLALESLQRMPVPGYLFRKKLQGDGAFEPGVFGFVDDAHTSVAQLLEDPIMRNGLADHGRSTQRNSCIAIRKM